MIIRSPKQLLERFNRLAPGDVYVGILPFKHLKKTFLIDLMERGIRCIPSPLSQILSGSKASQAVVFKDFMLPNTRVITRRSDLIESATDYHRKGIGPVVTKEDRMHCGHGVRKWESVELLYNVLGLTESSYPFVLQPFMDAYMDVRVIIVEDVMDAYTRRNPDNFRQNLSAGGAGMPYLMKPQEEALCRAVMKRGKFPFAHVDLHILSDGNAFLSEIALNGGMAGSKLDRKKLDQKKDAVLERLIREG
jgi:ribosomal protein S6--L-glutamate ligase